eukprot:6187987-Pleurochrysis_carterae.AAC.5
MPRLLCGRHRSSCTPHQTTFANSVGERVVAGQEIDVPAHAHTRTTLPVARARTPVYISRLGLLNAVRTDASLQFPVLSSLGATFLFSPPLYSICEALSILSTEPISSHASCIHTSAQALFRGCACSVARKRTSIDTPSRMG